MLHLNSRETTFEHQRVPAARFTNIFLKLFDRHTAYCYIQVDLKSFLGREATERATVSQVINSGHSSFLTVNQETNTSKSPGWATWTIFSVARGQVLRR